jgi:RNA polymerase sigma-70 factor (ECF subfamily)
MTQAARETGVTLSAETHAAQLYEQHRETIFRLCMRQLGRHEDAADAVQTTFVYALRSLRRGVVPQFELAWLWKIATNVCSTQRRSSAQRAHQDIDALHDILSAPERPADPIATDDLRAALRTLTPNQRQAILLREWKGLSYDEIGDELGLSQAATETLLYRARRTLARKLAATYAVDGFSLASLARSMLTSGAAKATAGAIGAAASIAATSIAIHELNKPVHHARHPTVPAVAQRSTASLVRQRVRESRSASAPVYRKRAWSRPSISRLPIAPQPDMASHSTATATAPIMPATSQSPPASTRVSAPTLTVPAITAPTEPVAADPVAALPPVAQLPDVLPTPSLPQPLSLPKLKP